MPELTDDDPHIDPQLAHGTARRLARLWLLYPRIEVLTLKRFDNDTVHARWRVAGLSRATQLGEVRRAALFGEPLYDHGSLYPPRPPAAAV